MRGVAEQTDSLRDHPSVGSCGAARLVQGLFSLVEAIILSGNVSLELLSDLLVVFGHLLPKIGFVRLDALVQQSLQLEQISPPVHITDYLKQHFFVYHITERHCFESITVPH